MLNCLRFSAAIALTVLLVYPAPAQEKIDADKLPPKVKDSLNARFPGNKITQQLKKLVLPQLNAKRIAPAGPSAGKRLGWALARS